MVSVYVFPAVIGFGVPDAPWIMPACADWAINPAVAINNTKKAL